MDLVHGAFSGLKHGDAILGVADTLCVATDLGAHFFADAEAGGVVGGAVDAVAAGELLEHFAELHAADAEVALSVQRGDVRHNGRHE